MSDADFRFHFRHFFHAAIFAIIFTLSILLSYYHRCHCQFSFRWSASFRWPAFISPPDCRCFSLSVRQLSAFGWPAAAFAFADIFAAAFRGFSLFRHFIIFDYAIAMISLRGYAIFLSLPDEFIFDIFFRLNSHRAAAASQLSAAMRRMPARLCAALPRERQRLRCAVCYAVVLMRRGALMLTRSARYAIDFLLPDIHFSFRFLISPAILRFRRFQLSPFLSLQAFHFFHFR
jgi:hypothetical protein